MNSRRSLHFAATGLEDDDFPCTRPAKRRKRVVEDLSSNIFEDSDLPPSSPPRSTPCPQPLTDDEGFDEEEAEEVFPTRIVRNKYYDRLVAPDPPWRSQASNFVSKPIDRHVFRAPPYCSSACHTNSLVAVGDEAGHVSLIDTAGDADFSKPFLRLRTHHRNAIMDLAFSADDTRLASAGGDKTANIIDMASQSTIYTMTDGHTATPKQILFQPGHENILATCGRDGCVQIWDLRCRANRRGSIPDSLAGVDSTAQHSNHQTVLPIETVRPGPISNDPATSTTTRPIAPASLTSLSFFPHQPHLFVTSTADSPRLRIWDMRSRFSVANPIPVSVTSLPASDGVPIVPHGPSPKHGITHTTFDEDGNTLFAVAKNSSVAAYQASHLVLGQALLGNCKERPRQGRRGAPPIWECRHEDLVVGSFYVRASMRPARGDRSPLLAVGSSTGSPVVFPMDRRGEAQGGTALVRGHGSEVTSVTWTFEGELVSVGDDGVVRVWREDGEAARELRRVGEAEGRRWGCGWADDGGDEGEDEG